MSLSLSKSLDSLIFYKGQWNGKGIKPMRKSKVEKLNYSLYHVSDLNTPILERPDKLYSQYIDALGSYCLDLERNHKKTSDGCFLIDAKEFWCEYLKHKSAPGAKEYREMYKDFTTLRDYFLKVETIKTYKKTQDAPIFEALLDFSTIIGENASEGGRFQIKLKSMPIIFKRAYDLKQITTVSDPIAEIYTSAKNEPQVLGTGYTIRMVSAMKHARKEVVKDLENILNEIDWQIKELESYYRAKQIPEKKKFRKPGKPGKMYKENSIDDRQLVEQCFNPGEDERRVVYRFRKKMYEFFETLKSEGMIDGFTKVENKKSSRGRKLDLEYKFTFPEDSRIEELKKDIKESSDKYEDLYWKLLTGQKIESFDKEANV